MQLPVYQSIEQKRKHLEQKRKELEETQLNAFRELLPNDVIERVCDQSGYAHRKRLLTPLVTIFHMLGAAISRENSFQSAWHTIGQSGQSGSLSRARGRLPLTVWKRLHTVVTDTMENEHERTWHGHRVLAIDGTCVSMSDEGTLVDYFGRAGSKEGQSRFPIARAVVAFSLTTFRAVSHSIGPYATGENTLFASLMPRLKKSDLIVADRRYAGAKLYVGYLRKGIEFITRAHQRLKIDRLSVVKELGKHDLLVDLPIQQMYRKNDQTLPAFITVRVIQIQARIRGREETFWVVTSLLDHQEYPANEIKALYKKRWRVEGLIEELKLWLGADVLRSKTVEGVYKELHARVIAYNLIHWLILKAAKKHDKSHERLSTAAALRLIACYNLKMSTAPAWRLIPLYETLLGMIAFSVVPYRPDRIEPRKKRRDQKHYSILKISRAEWRQINGSAA